MKSLVILPPGVKSVVTFGGSLFSPLLLVWEEGKHWEQKMLVLWGATVENSKTHKIWNMDEEQH